MKKNDNDGFRWRYEIRIFNNIEKNNIYTLII